MSKSSRNLSAVVAFLVLGLLVALVVFVIKVAYDEPLPPDQQETQASDVSITTESETEPPKDTKIAFFHTNDINGYLVDTTSGSANTFQYRLAYIAKAVDDARESSDFDDVILVDGGDIYRGTPISDFTEGAAMRAAFDIMGYDAVTLGNHDFDWDVSTLATDTFCSMPAYEIGEYTGDSGIPVIASNLCYSNNHNRTLFTKDYVMVEKAGYRICLIGYIPDYLDSIKASNAEPFEIHADLGEFSERIKNINESEKPDITIVVAHASPDDLAEALDANEVDLVAGANGDGICGTASNGIPYVCSVGNAEGYASATIVIKHDGYVSVQEPVYNCITEYPDLLYDTLSNSGSFNEDVLKLSHDSWSAITEQMNEALGYIDTSVETSNTISGSTTTAGNFITSLILERMKKDGVAAVFCSMEGVSIDKSVPEDGILELATGDFYMFCPYNRALLIYELTGEEIAKLLADGLTDPGFGDQMSGLTFEYKNIGTEDVPVYEIVSIKLSSGTEISVNGTETKYKICVTDSCASKPGSVFEGKTPSQPATEAPVDNQVIIALLRERRDKGLVHIPTDSKPRGVCLDAPAETDETEATETTETTEEN